MSSDLTRVLPEDRTASGRARTRVQRHLHRVRRDGTARPVFVVGVQRSGTNMVVRGVDGRDRWQSQGLSEETLQQTRQADPERLSPESAAALFWVVRTTQRSRGTTA